MDVYIRNGLMASVPKLWVAEQSRFVTKIFFFITIVSKI